MIKGNAIRLEREFVAGLLIEIRRIREPDKNRIGDGRHIFRAKEHAFNESRHDNRLARSGRGLQGQHLIVVVYTVVIGEKRRCRAMPESINGLGLKRE